MNSIIYKRLFEVRILHDYYIMTAYEESSNTSFFIETPNDQSIILDKILKLDQYKISNYFELKPLEKTKELLQQYKIRVINNPLGFFLGVEVDMTKTPTGGGAYTITYQPKIAFPDNFHFQFLLNSTDADLYKRAILPQPSLLNSRFYFTNYNDLGNKTFPTLSEGVNGLVDTADFNFLPFNISVAATTGNTVKSTLKKTDGTVVLVKEKLATSDRVNINMRQRNTYVQDETLIQDDLYQLEILDGNVGPPEETHFFSDQYFSESNFGFLDFYVDAKDGTYNLLETNQIDLKTKKDVDSGGNITINKHPVFELRFNGIF